MLFKILAEFFRLKGEEIGCWIVDVFLSDVLPVIGGIILLTHFVTSLVFFVLFVCGVDGTWTEFWILVSFLLWICVFLIWASYCIISWFASNWEQAVRNVKEKI